MTQRNDVSVPETTMDAFYAAMSTYGNYLAGGYTRRGSTGTRLVFTGIPSSNLNMVYVEPERSLAEVDEFAGELSAKNTPWSIQVRGEADADLRALAARYGMTAEAANPLLLWDAEHLSTLPTALPQGAKVRVVHGAEWDVLAAAMAAGFGVPRDMANLLVQPTLLDAPGVTGYVLELAGEGVATGHNIRIGEHVVMLGGSVPKQHRSNGYYRALVAARLRDAVADGARYAISENSPMSRRLFEAFGAEHFETMTHLSAS